MSRVVTIGNGNLLVGIDNRAQVRDFYFPYVGHANHISGASGSYTHRVGVWVDGVMRWLSHDSWDIHTTSEQDGAVQNFVATNNAQSVRLVINDSVHNEYDIFLRKITVTNLANAERLIKVFFGQEFRISESRRGDTGFYDPRVDSVVHYKGHHAFLVHARLDNIPMSDYSIGLFGIENKEGTYTDAEDGILSKNPIEHGSVDSVISVAKNISPQDSGVVHYWIAAGKNIADTHRLHNRVLDETPDALINSTHAFWHAWMNKKESDFACVEEKLSYLYKRSLLIIKTHADNRGGIIASSDTDILNQGRDTYSYVWPRDSALSAYALDCAGYSDVSQKYFSFISKLIEPDGYLMHKYRVDGVLGSSWHPWMRNEIMELPIQEDETALPIYMLAQHYMRTKNIEFIESLYNPFIEPAADFMCGYIEEETGLPVGSYDLWEEKFGSSTYSACAVYGALHGAADISAVLGKRGNAEKYRNAAERIKEAILTYLYDVELQSFIKLVRHEGKERIYDKTIDISSFHGVVYFNLLDIFDERVKSTLRAVEERLKVPTSYGGYMRYEGDNYYRTWHDTSPNPWCITTLWIAQYYIRIARTQKELEQAYGILLWIFDRATASGVLPEQINPHTGEHLSTSPLVWSHAEFVITLHEYIKKSKRLR